MVRDGYAAIRIADATNPDNSRWQIDVLAETRDLALPAGEPFTLAASGVDEAGGGTALSLSVNGEPVLSVGGVDRLPQGSPGVIIYPPPSDTSPENPVAVRFLDFAVARPQ